MFDKLIWRYRYIKFKHKWFHLIENQHREINLDFIEEMFDLVKTLSSRDIDELYYKPDIIIPTSYKTVDDFLEASVRVKNNITQKQFKNQPTLPVFKMKLADFMVTKEGYEVTSYHSALTAVKNVLTELVIILRGLAKNEQDYWLRQSKELFQTGIMFYQTLIEGYAS